MSASLAVPIHSGSPPPDTRRLRLDLVVAAALLGVVGVYTGPPIAEGFLIGANVAIDARLGSPEARAAGREIAKGFVLGNLRTVGSYAGRLFAMGILIPVAEKHLKPNLERVVTDDVSSFDAEGNAIGREVTVDRAEAETLAQKIAVQRIAHFVGLGGHEFIAPFMIVQDIPNCPQVCAYRAEALRVSADGKVGGTLVGASHGKLGTVEGRYFEGTLRLSISLPYNGNLHARDAVVGPTNKAKRLVEIMQAAP